MNIVILVEYLLINVLSSYLLKIYFLHVELFYLFIKKSCHYTF